MTSWRGDKVDIGVERRAVGRETLVVNYTLISLEQKTTLPHKYAHIRCGALEWAF